MQLVSVIIVYNKWPRLPDIVGQKPQYFSDYPSLGSVCGIGFTIFPTLGNMMKLQGKQFFHKNMLPIFFTPVVITWVLVEVGEELNVYSYGL